MMTCWQKSILYFSVCLISFNGFPQSPITVFRDNGNYKYFVGTTAPDTLWQMPEYNDSSWTVGNKCIGFGDGDDSTLIPSAPSVYLRIRFNIDSTNVGKIYNFVTDFDDGFVAYLNGYEICRVNLGQPGEYIPYNRLTDRSHEAQNYRNYFQPVNGYYIDSATISKSLVTGENILAIQVHNDSISGSDLTFKCKLLKIDHISSYFNLYDSELRFIKQIKVDSTQFPIIKIETDEYGTYSSSEKFIAIMGIIHNGDGNWNKPDDPFNEFYGRISIELRGHSSLYWPKKSYNIETQDILGENNNVSLLGMPEENDWILYGPYTDKSLIRNELAFALGRKMGHYEPRTKFCELYINDKFLGLYVLTEKIKRDENRVSISKLLPEDIDSIEITGGYIIKYDKGSTGIQSVYPRPGVMITDQWSYITTYISDYFRVLDKPEFLKPQLGYKKFIDDSSLIDYIIINEALRNCDAYLYSTYMYKDKDTKDGRLKFGPLWDFDYSLGNVTWQSAQLTTGWQFAINTKLNITKVMRDTSFTRKLNARWDNLRESYFHTDSLIALIDKFTTEIEVARIRNYKVWPIIQYQLTNYDFAKTYEQDLANAKNWLIGRLNWMDQNMPLIYYPLPPELSINSIVAESICNAYPNPFSNVLYVDINIHESGKYTFEMYDMFGRKLSIISSTFFDFGNYTLIVDKSTLQSIAPGLTIIAVFNENKMVFSTRLIKK
ncbi:MAG: CotH kinase family protein [Bacteroidales bacterium]|nr:CotH kinase family protein [Bacteroidales bacterium]